jgi:dTDP-glucose 4,6-dehydratase
MTVLVTGGAGFIGSNFILDWFKNTNIKIINLDKLTYAGHLENLSSLEKNENYHFFQGDIIDFSMILKLLKQHEVSQIIHFAAESHVDRSISSPEVFIETNVLGTLKLLEASKEYWEGLTDTKKEYFRFIHISTDEVYGSLHISEPAFTEQNPYQPNSPYAASKAASDHLVRAYKETYGLPVMITNCSNNYGPFQFPEKFIPMCITRALSHQSIGIYGDGLQIRDWLYVSDHCAAIRKILSHGKVGETYNIGGNNEKTNIEVATIICKILDNLRPRQDGLSYCKQIQFIKDRPGHDRRYAINATKLQSELNWAPKETFDSGIQKTVTWYLENMEWLDQIWSKKNEQ